MFKGNNIETRIYFLLLDLSIFLAEITFFSKTNDMQLYPEQIFVSKRRDFTSPATGHNLKAFSISSIVVFILPNLKPNSA